MVITICLFNKYSCPGINAKYSNIRLTGLGFPPLANVSLNEEVGEEYQIAGVHAEGKINIIISSRTVPAVHDRIDRETVDNDTNCHL